MTNITDDFPIVPIIDRFPMVYFPIAFQKLFNAWVPVRSAKFAKSGYQPLDEK